MTARKSLVSLLTIVFTLAATTSLATAQDKSTEDKPLAVFPGAQGFGTHTIGGRSGKACIVTSTEDSGLGTLRDCLKLNEPRMVVFNVSGIISVDSTLKISNPFISVFGQTAPEPGVMIKANTNFNGALFKIETHDVLLQHLRLRAGGSSEPSCCRDALSIANKNPGNVYNVVIDHSSIQWGTDEVMDIWYDSNNITISNSIISEGLHRSTNDKGPAGRGIVIGSENSHSISLHRNLLAHNYQRNPLIKSDGVVDVVNNLVFHWVSRAAGVQGEYGDVNVNFVKNIFLSKPTGAKGQTSDLRWYDITVDPMGNKINIYLEGNKSKRQWWFISTQSSLVGKGKRSWGFNNNKEFLVNQRHPAPPIDEVATENLEAQLLVNVGASLPSRDATDSRIIQQVKTRSGFMIDCVSPDDPTDTECKYHLGGWPSYTSAGSPRVDSDKDGIPDDWEIESGLDPYSTSDATDLHSSGYSHLEQWVHSLELN